MLMFDIKGKATANVFVKGFAQEVDYDKLVSPSDCQDEFVAIITDLVTSEPLMVTSAVLTEAGKWSLKCTDGTALELEAEPKTPREMVYAIPVTNFRESVWGNSYDVVFPEDYDIVSRAISEGKQSYRLIGYIDRQKVVTSRFVKFWTDGTGKHHGITKSGSHYVF